MIPELVAAYPNAKFLLTLRDSQEIWWKSWEGTVGMQFFEKRLRYKVFRTLISSVRFMRRTDDMAQEDRIRLIQDFGPIGPQLYSQHNQRVRDLVPKEPLLEYNVKEGWKPLCTFLGVEAPDEPFPRLNEKRQHQSGLLWPASLQSVCVDLVVRIDRLWCLRRAKAWNTAVNVQPCFRLADEDFEVIYLREGERMSVMVGKLRGHLHPACISRLPRCCLTLQ
jgi:hypothetical protein